MMTEAQIEARRKGGRVLHSPEMLALRLSRSWPELGDREREVVGAILGPLVRNMGRTPVQMIHAQRDQLTDDEREVLEDVLYGEDRVR
jgi:hypothetical protein